MIEHVLDGSGVRSKRAMFAALARTLRFPKWFGNNLDALYDCLSDLSWLPADEHVLIWTHSSVLAGADPAGYDAIRGVFDDAVEATAGSDRPLQVVIAREQP